MYRALILLLAGCSSAPSAVTVTLSNSTFGTTGGNLFNCGSPQFPANRYNVNGTHSCPLPLNADGSYSTTPVTVRKKLGCSDGHGAYLVITCAGTGAPHEVTGSVSLALEARCDAEAPMGQTFNFQKMTPGMSQMQTLSECDVFSSFCPTNNACGFNQLKADVTVSAN